FWCADSVAVHNSAYEGGVFPMIRCPASSLPEWNKIDEESNPVTGYRAYEPTYTCILGSARHPSTDTTARNGPVSDGGVLVLRVSKNQTPRLTDITDGTSNTIMVGEQSDWSFPLQSDPLYSDMRSSDSRGAFMGTSYVSQPRGKDSLIGCKGDGTTVRNNNCMRCYNTTTVVAPIGSKTF